MTYRHSEACGCVVVANGVAGICQINWTEAPPRKVLRARTYRFMLWAREINAWRRHLKAKSKKQ